MHRFPRVISLGSLGFAVAVWAYALAFTDEGLRMQIIGLTLGPLGMPTTLVLPVPLIFVPASWDPTYIISPVVITAAFLIQWQFVAWLLLRFLRRREHGHAMRRKT